MGTNERTNGGRADRRRQRPNHPQVEEEEKEKKRTSSEEPFFSFHATDRRRHVPRVGVMNSITITPSIPIRPPAPSASSSASVRPTATQPTTVQNTLLLPPSALPLSPPSYLHMRYENMRGGGGGSGRSLPLFPPFVRRGFVARGAVRPLDGEREKNIKL